MSIPKTGKNSFPPKDYLDQIKHYRELVLTLGDSPKNRYTLEKDISKYLFKPGIYAIGELSQFEKDSKNLYEYEEEFCEGYWFETNGVYKANNGTLFTNIKTCWGDGIYLDNLGNEYIVDHGSIGCISEDEIVLRKNNKVALFPEPFTVNYDKNTAIMRFGSLFIDTDFLEIGNREIYFYDPSNTYEPNHPANKSKKSIHVKILPYYEALKAFPKNKKNISIELIKYIKKSETKIGKWGENTNDYGFKKSASMGLLSKISKKIKLYNNYDEEKNRVNLINLFEKSKSDIKDWLINIKEEIEKIELEELNKEIEDGKLHLIKEDENINHKRANPIKIYFDKNTYLENIDIERFQKIIKTSINFLKNRGDV